MKFHGQFDEPVDKILLERYFKYSTNPGFFVECGAFDGVTESCCYVFEKYLGWKGVNFEPSPPIFNKLVQNRPDSINLNLALSNKSGSQEFVATVHPMHGDLFGNGSLRHSLEHIESLRKENVEFVKYSIETIDYASFIQKYDIKNIDVFALDVEGLELDIISTLHLSSVRPKIFAIEYTHIGLEKLNKIMTDLGYIFDFTRDNNAFYIFPPVVGNMLSSVLEHQSKFDLGNRLSTKLYDFQKEIDIIRSYEKDHVNRFYVLRDKIEAVEKATEEIKLCFHANRSFLTKMISKIARLFKKYLHSKSR